MAVYVLACMWPQIQFLAHIKMQIALILKYRIPGLVNPTGIGWKYEPVWKLLFIQGDRLKFYNIFLLLNNKINKLSFPGWTIIGFGDL